MAISISDCLPKHLAHRLGKQRGLEETLIQCLPIELQSFCTFTLKNGQVTVHTVIASHLVTIRQFAPRLQQCLWDHFPKFATTAIHFKVTPRADRC
jgi:hypothetical protein